MSTTSAIDPFVATASGARVAAWEELAETGPIQRLRMPNGEQAWLVTGYAEARAALADARLVKAAIPQITEVRRQRLLSTPAITQHMLHVDGLAHERLRRLVSAAFTRRRVDLLAPAIQDIADGLLDEVAAGVRDGRVVDLIAAFAYPLPMAVICDLMGVPEHLRPAMRRGSEAMATSVGITDEQFLPAFDAFVEALQELVTIKRRAPGDDLISGLIAVRDGDDALSEDELSSMAFLLIYAGHETTVNMIANGTHALLSHPDQLARLRDQPPLIPAAVEELLRWCGPVQVTIPLVAGVPVELGGVTVAPGEIVLPGLFAANRDPAHIEEPATLDVTRAGNSHLAFGHGIHHCLGAPLARIEGRIAFSSLLRRFPDLRLAEPADSLRWRPGFMFNGLARLPVLLD